jgi:hypothetical protein
MAQVIRAPERPRGIYYHVAFIAGPIQGAADWQSSAIKHLEHLPDTVLIACPRRINVPKGDFDDTMYLEQVAWEHEYLERAMRNGVVMFWLAKEEKHDCSRAYAQTSRFELGEACVLSSVLNGEGAIERGNLVVGIESGFPNERYLRHTLTEKRYCNHIFKDLEQTCLDAAVLLSNMNRMRKA